MIQQPERRVWPWYTWAIAIVAMAMLLRVAFGLWNTFAPAKPAENVPAATTSGAAMQTNEGGQVTIKATWQGPSAGPVFEIVMDTHAVDLDSYDLTQLAVLRVDGTREVRPASWDAPKGGHHRKGTLAFPTTAADGRALVGPGTRTVELIVRDVAGVPERIFRWTPQI
jgi:hypothetical protein